MVEPQKLGLATKWAAGDDDAGLPIMVLIASPHSNTTRPVATSIRAIVDSQ